MRKLFLGILLMGASWGCKTPCRSLSEKLCECSVNSVQRDECVRQAARNESTYVPTAEDQDTCESLLDVCDCNAIDTPEGKKNCGLAEP